MLRFCQVITIVNTTLSKSVLSILTYGVILLPDSASYDKLVYSSSCRHFFIIIFQPINLYGAPGLGGQFGYGDNSAKLGVAYTTNFLKLDMAEFDENDPRFQKYLDAVYSCLSTIEGTDKKREIFPNYGVFEKAKDAAKK